MKWFYATLTLLMVLAVAAACVSIYGCQVATEQAEQRQQEAEKDGEAAGRAGIPAEACPFHSRDPRYETANAWKRGWIKGKLEAGK